MKTLHGNSIWQTGKAVTCQFSDNKMETITLNHGHKPEVEAKIALFGAHVTSWKVGGDEVIFMSSKSVRDGSKPIRGGIPFCFPQFADRGSGRFHGFARSSTSWIVDADPATDPATGDASVTLVLEDDELSRAEWGRNRFHLRYKITLLEANLLLEVEVENHNHRNRPFIFTSAFHTYFKVADIAEVGVVGFSDTRYIDKTDNMIHRTQLEHELKVNGFTDRIYYQPYKITSLKNVPRAGMAIRMARLNMGDVVVWNPWTELAKQLDDLDDNEFKTMICVEAGAISEPVVVPANGTANFGMMLEVKEM